MLQWKVFMQEMVPQVVQFKSAQSHLLSSGVGEKDVLVGVERELEVLSVGSFIRGGDTKSKCKH